MHWVVVIALLVFGHGVASADDHKVLIKPGSDFRYVAYTAPPTTAALGRVALAGLDAAAGNGAALPSALGDIELSLGAFPAGDLPAAAKTGSAPFGTRDRKRCKPCKTVVADGRVERGVAIYATRSFELSSSHGLTSLELRVRYRDGIAVHLNGREVMRRNLNDVRAPVAIARRKRGPEWESVWIPITPGLVRAGSNRLAVEVRPSGFRAGPFLDLELRGWSGLRLTRGPLIQRPDPSTAVVRFTTDAPSKAVVEWGPTRALGQRAASAGGGLALNHRAAIAGIEPGQPFFYRVRAGAAVTEIHQVAAWPTEGTVRFAVYGDMRGGHRVHDTITKAILREAADFVVVTGDLVLRGSDGGDWQRFFAVAAKLLAQTPYYPVAGNHDIGRSGDERRLMNELFELPLPKEGRPAWGNWYSFDVAGVHVVMLDSNAYRNKSQLAWLKADLAKARAGKARAIVAAVHDGPYSRGLHRGNRYAQANYVPVLIEHKVDILFSGHDHLYQRGQVKGLRYVVSGGGGAPLYSVRCGGKKQRRCKVDDGKKHVESTYHYLMVTIRGRSMELCAKRPDGTPVEACVRYRLRR